MQRFAQQKRLASMKNLYLILLALLAFSSCSKRFKPDMTGLRTSVTDERTLNLLRGFQRSEVKLPGSKNVRYGDPQWAKNENVMLVTQTVKSEQCVDSRIVTIDTLGKMIDVIYQPEDGIQVEFRLAPNDSLMVVRTRPYCKGVEGKAKLNFYNRYENRFLDSIPTGYRPGRHDEKIWSADSKRIILVADSLRSRNGYIYDRVHETFTLIDAGKNFLWSPKDNDEIWYIKNYSIYKKNMRTGKTERVRKGTRKQSVEKFVFNPTGDFLILYVDGYLLGIEIIPLWFPKVYYFSIPDKRESILWDGEDSRHASWKTF